MAYLKRLLVFLPTLEFSVETQCLDTLIFSIKLFGRTCQFGSVHVRGLALVSASVGSEHDWRHGPVPNGVADEHAMAG